MCLSTITKPATWLAVVSAAVAFLLMTPMTNAQVESAEVAVEGISCPFCAFGLEKRLRKIDGVGSVEVDLGAGTATLTAVSGESIDLAAIPRAVERAGFSTGPVEATAVGTISAATRGKRLTIGDDQFLFLVNLDDSLESRLSAAERAGTAVRVRGAVHFHADDPPGLEPRKADGDHADSSS